MAKIAQYKRKLMALSHRTLQVTRIFKVTHSDVQAGARNQTERGGIPSMTSVVVCTASVENEILISSKGIH